MGSYEDEYRKYYSNAKAKLNIKSELKISENKSNFKKEKTLNLESSEDIYPKTNYNYDEDNIYSKNEKRSNYIIEEGGGGTYKGIGSYSGIDNYNNPNSYKVFDGHNGRPYYGYNGRQNLNSSTEEKNIIGKWGNRVIIELLLTVVLFASVIGIKSLPYKEAKTIYTTFKGIVSTSFDYKNFIEYAKTIDVMKEVDKIKGNLKIKLDDVNTFKAKNKDENIDDVTSDKVEESTN